MKARILTHQLDTLFIHTLEQALRHTNLELEEWSDLSKVENREAEEHVLLIIYVEKDFSQWKQLHQWKYHNKLSEIILIISEKNFDFAYEALQLGVMQLHVMPLAKEAVKGMVQAFTDKIRQVEVARDREEKLNSYELIKHQQLMEKIMTKMMDHPEELSMLIGEVNDRYDLHIKKEKWIGVQIVFGDSLRQERLSALGEQLLLALKTHMICASEIILSPRMDCMCTVVISMSESAKVEQWVKELKSLKDVMDDITQKWDITTYVVGVGTEVNQMEEVASSLQNALVAMHDYNQNPTERLYFFREEKQSQPVMKDSQKFRFLNYVQSGKQQDAIDVIRNSFTEIEREWQEDPYVVQLLLKQWMGVLQELCKSAYEKSPLADSEIAKSYEYIYDNHKKINQFLTDIRILVSEHDNATDNYNGELIQNSVAYIQAHYMEQLTLDSLAREVGLSPNYFSLQFKELIGMNYLEYLTDYRMKVSTELLKNTTLTILEVAERVGYQDNKYFSKLFKKNYGVTPGAYRNIKE